MLTLVCQLLERMSSVQVQNDQVNASKEEEISENVERGSDNHLDEVESSVSTTSRLLTIKPRKRKRGKSKPMEMQRTVNLRRLNYFEKL